MDQVGYRDWCCTAGWCHVPRYRQFARDSNVVLAGEHETSSLAVHMTSVGVLGETIQMLQLYVRLGSRSFPHFVGEPPHRASMA